jgi:hypothetical protein
MILLPKEPIARPPYIIYRGNDPESRQFPLLKTGESVFSFSHVFLKLLSSSRLYSLWHTVLRIRIRDPVPF